MSDYRTTRRIADRHETEPAELRDVQVHETGYGTAKLILEAPRDEVWSVEAALRDEAVRLRRDDEAEPLDDSAESPIPARSLGAYMADAVINAVHAQAANGPADVSGADRQTLVIHADAEDFTDPGSGADRSVPVQITAGARSRRRTMSVRTLRRLACDAKIAVVTHDDDGDPAGVSGTTRRVPSRLRRMLLARDRSCRFPSCGTSGGLDAHHLVHVADGGETTLENLVLLCRFHHGFIHTSGWELLTDGKGHFRFQPPDAPSLPTVGALPGDSAESPPRWVEELDPKVLQPSWDGSRPDYHLCVTALQDELRRLAAPV